MLLVSQPEERSLSGRIFDDLPQRQQPIAHGRAPDHLEQAFFLIRKAKVGGPSGPRLGCLGAGYGGAAELHRDAFSTA